MRAKVFHAFYQGGSSRISLHQSGIYFHFNRKAPDEDVFDILQGRSRGGSDDAYLIGILGQRTLVSLVEQSFFLQLGLQALKLEGEIALACQANVFHVKVISSSLFVERKLAKAHHLQAVFQAEIE